MKIAPLLLLIILTACSERPAKLTTRDYVTVGKMMDTVKTPYVLDVQNGDKRVIFVGCEHVYDDTTHPQFKKMEMLFQALKPEIAFNEGGQVNKKYASKSAAIMANGETGMLKFCADKAGIQMLNGDLQDSLEFKTMLKKVPREQLYLYFVVERIIGPYAMGAYREKTFDENVQQKIKKWFVDEGFPLAKNEQDLAYFKRLYKKYLGKDFNYTGKEYRVEDFDLEDFDYINDNCKFCAIGRISKEVRDSVLLSKIDNALNKYDRVFITFGHGHALAVEPALREIVRRKR